MQLKDGTSGMTPSVLEDIYCTDLEQHMLLYILYFSGEENDKHHTESIIATWLVRVRSPGAELACLQPKSFTSWKYLAHDDIKNKIKMALNCWIATILHQTRTMDNYSLPKVHKLISRFLWTLFNRRLDAKHGPVPTCFRHVAAIKFQISSYFS